MAQRRMFSLKIINSARFLKMPSSSQLLYFHLGLNADDDGVVEGYNVMRMIGCSDDDLKILSAKGFIVVLNEDLVSFVTDWKEHNLIRSDRKVDSIYKNLLLQIVSDVNLLESRPRADLKPKIMENLNDNGQPVDTQLTTIGTHRLGKVRLGKVRLGEDSIDQVQKAFLSDSDEYRLSTFLWNYIKKNNEKAKEPNLQSWSKTFDLMIRLDKRSVDDIKKVIVFCQQNEFWYKNILSPAKLREHYDKLTLQMKEPKYNNKNKKSSAWDLPQSDYIANNNMGELEKKLLGWENDD